MPQALFCRLLQQTEMIIPALPVPLWGLPSFLVFFQKRDRSRLAGKCLLSIDYNIYSKVFYLLVESTFSALFLGVAFVLLLLVYYWE